ncbi:MULTISPECIES: phosphoribosylaminoimidazolecarboxamide formyltransferase [Pseudofrankia]|uniref:phosphoribosylaminoimidazolecarboxamide formyltransferase n=1 Tax=Pseudofrankia TaxID=2994363 RepID=UPI000234D60A|nr:MULTISPECIES: phosphoribosylaminoimidazolecarboxamide formyltransferase [Pseudofrankia]OHV35617.1 5-aminoimidazole-4-carboxamide ribonucleotide transformylase [Pseudofrankia sp. EUN1h]
MDLRYGMNPHQQPATANPVDDASPPVRVLHGQPSYINMLDALEAWQLVREAADALGRPAAASFKHLSPAGAALAGPLDETMTETYGLGASPVGMLTSAYVRARDTDPKSSYGDFAAVSAPVDAELAVLLRRLVCDGIVAPGYEPGTVATLSAKKNGTFLVLEADPAHRPPAREIREVHGMRFTQTWDDAVPNRQTLADVRVGTVPDHALDDLLLGLIVARHTQSNSVAYVRGGMTLGVGAGQQSRVDCVRLAGAKSDTWWLRRHPRVRALHIGQNPKIQDSINDEIQYLDTGAAGSGLPPRPGGAPPLTALERAQWLSRLDEVSLASDGALPFPENIVHARRHGVRYVAEPGGSIRSAEVIAACHDQEVALVHTGLRLFRH